VLRFLLRLGERFDLRVAAVGLFQPAPRPLTTDKLGKIFEQSIHKYSPVQKQKGPDLAAGPEELFKLL
jgi:hypothetical protein